MKGGVYFNDSDIWNLTGKAYITEIMTVCNANGLLTAIQMKYGGILAGIRGSFGGSPIHHELDQDEFVTTIETESDLKFLMNDMKIVTNKNRTIGPCGPFPASGRRIMEHSGGRLLYIAGYYGTAIDTLVFHWN